ncbi:hypothetical protein BU17DRAFT_62631 [Hysterangium stoloniferum]|nr:hypothetical protein BU17DRAFT_62631 [Hysterangium stoloniferum]
MTNDIVISSSYTLGLSFCPPPFKSLRNAAAANSAARLAAVGPSAAAPPSAAFAHTFADSSRFVEKLPVKEWGGRFWIMAVPNGVCKSLWMRLTVAETEMRTRAMELHSTADLSWGERLGACIGYLLLITPLLSIPFLLDPAAPRMVFRVSSYSGVGTHDVPKAMSELFDSGIRAYTFTDYTHEWEAQHHSFELRAAVTVTVSISHRDDSTEYMVDSVGQVEDSVFMNFKGCGVVSDIAALSGCCAEVI